MIVKKKYAVGDTVWIYGINRDNTRSVQGTVIKMFTIDYGNYNKEPHYLVEVPTEIEPLLEVRTWHTISQSKDGHVGGLRDAFSDTDAAHKMLARTGVAIISTDDKESIDEELDKFQEHMLEEDEDIDPDLIHAAMLRSQESGTVPPMSPTKSSKRRYYKKKN
jgi:hypothetical protein